MPLFKVDSVNDNTHTFIMTKKLLLTSILILLSYVALHAQRVQVIDSNGMPIPFVIATSGDGKCIGTTDVDGWMSLAATPPSPCRKWPISP